MAEPRNPNRTTFQELADFGHSIGYGATTFRYVTIESGNGLKVDSAESKSGLTIDSESGASDSPVHAYNLNRFIVGTTKAPQLA